MYARVAELAGRAAGARARSICSPGSAASACHLARAGAEVIAVEIDREAVAQLRRAAQRADLPLDGDRRRRRRAAARRPRCARGPPDVVVVNPPRKGLAAGARDLLADARRRRRSSTSAAAPRRSAAISSRSPARGWAPDAIEPFDLMPGTAQVETIVRLRRADAP